MEARYDQRGRRVPVTILAVEPNIIIETKDGKVVLGAGVRKKVKKPQSKLVEKIGYLPRFIKEAKVGSDSTKGEGEVKIGDKITVAIFSPQDAVKVTGVTKGHGFAGGVKRWGFHGGPKTHGQSDRHRAIGSIGQTTTPGRVFKGKRMAGHYGNTNLTITNLEVVEVDQGKNLLLVKGSVPGAKNGFVTIEKTGKVKSYTPPPEEKPKEEEEETQPKEKKDAKDSG